MNESEQEGLTPDELLTPTRYSPADNTEGYPTSIPWISRLVGAGIRSCFQWKNILGEISRSPLLFGPMALAAAAQHNLMEAWLTGPIRTHSRIATRAGRTPDIFVEWDERTEATYALLIRRLCGRFMREGAFDTGKARETAASEEGRRFLRECMEEFTWLEHRYATLGKSRLAAMKELLKTLLMVITGKPLVGQPLPFRKGEAPSGEEFAEYLESARLRLEQLYAHDAFDIRSYSERATGSRIGCTPYETVEGSRLHAMSLRHYPLPEGISPNGKVLYLASPLINKPEIFDLAPGKSVVEGMLKEGYTLYLQDPGEPGPEESHLGLDFFGKTVHDAYIALIKARHPEMEIHAMGYCMGGTLLLPYLARRAEERLAEGKGMDIRRVALMASPMRFDDGGSGHGPMRRTIEGDYDHDLMKEMYGTVGVPSHLIEVGMNEIQPGVRYSVASGFYNRAAHPGAIDDAAPFLYWLTHGTRFPARAHRQWISDIFVGNAIEKGTYALPSSRPELDGRPVTMEILARAGLAIFDYRGDRDPISPTGSCIASEKWGLCARCNVSTTGSGLNRTIEKNIGHIFVVSRKLLAEFLGAVTTFFREEEYTSRRFLVIEGDGAEEESPQTGTK